MSKKKNRKTLDENQAPENLIYPPKEDIYYNEKREDFSDENFPGEDLQKPDTSLNKDLDIPGSELDDKNEDIGEEDEENNYYSLGGDNHNNLEEDPST